MNTATMPPLEPQGIAELYQRAAQELLHAYQRNKEATRHHGSGAYRAALHHARMSCLHSAAAHECLTLAFERSDQLLACDVPQVCTTGPMPVRRDH